MEFFLYSFVCTLISSFFFKWYTKAQSIISIAPAIVFRSQHQAKQPHTVIYLMKSDMCSRGSHEFGIVFKWFELDIRNIMKWKRKKERLRCLYSYKKQTYSCNVSISSKWKTEKKKKKTQWSTMVFHYYKFISQQKSVHILSFLFQ